MWADGEVAGCHPTTPGGRCLGDHRAAPRRSRHRFNPFRTTPITPARQTTRALTELGTARARVLASTTSGLTRQQIDTAVTLAVVGGLVVTAMWAGRRWARPTLIGVALCSGLTDLRQGPHLAEALNGTSLLLLTAGVIACTAPPLPPTSRGKRLRR